MFAITTKERLKIFGGYFFEKELKINSLSIEFQPKSCGVQSGTIAKANGVSYYIKTHQNGF